jgi:CO/xanthine dehydrogenase Mo-binding subunit
MLWGKILRSPVPHARIVTIETSRARKLAGVKAVITAQDVTAKLTGRTLSDLRCWRATECASSAIKSPRWPPSIKTPRKKR